MARDSRVSPSKVGPELRGDLVDGRRQRVQRLVERAVLVAAALVVRSLTASVSEYGDDVRASRDDVGRMHRAAARPAPGSGFVRPAVIRCGCVRWFATPSRTLPSTRKVTSALPSSSRHVGDGADFDAGDVHVVAGGDARRLRRTGPDSAPLSPTAAVAAAASPTAMTSMISATPMKPGAERVWSPRYLSIRAPRTFPRLA